MNCVESEKGWLVFPLEMVLAGGDYLVNFIQNNPDIYIRQVKEEPDIRGEIFDQAKLDFAITDLKLQSDELDCLELFQEDFVIAVSKGHPLAGRSEEILSIAEFQDDLFIFRTELDILQQRVVSMLKKIGFHPRKSMAMDYMLRYRIFNQSGGVIITTRQVMKYEDSLSDAVCLQVKEFADFSFSDKLYWKKSPPLSPSAVQFKECLQSYVQKLR